MNPMINTFLMTVGDREFLLADVIKSSQSIGTCSVSGRASDSGDRSPFTELFYVGDEAIVNIASPTPKDKSSNKMISQVGSVSDENIKARLSAASDNYFIYSQNITKSLQPVLEILNTGLYVCHVSKMIPSDGAGNFFWNAYNIRHEITGSSEINTIMGRESNYIPCFLIPTIAMANYSEARTRAQTDKLVNGKSIGGLAFHLSGMFSALLDGHHSATACLINNVDFNCVVIEPVKHVLYESLESAVEYSREPKIIALSCPYVKIPIDAVPESMMENFLLKRYNEKPNNYETIKSKGNRSVRTVSKKSIIQQVYTGVELLPDCAMIESAHVVTSLSNEQLDALLAGETKYNDEIIITNNYYNSVVTACNYLQYSDFKRFLNFSLSILNSPDLLAVHKYIAERLSNIIDEHIYIFFQEILQNSEEDNTYSEIASIAENYITRFESVNNERAREKKKSTRFKKLLPLVDSEMDSIGLAQMEAFVKKTRGSTRRGE